MPCCARLQPAPSDLLFACLKNETTSDATSMLCEAILAPLSNAVATPYDCLLVRQKAHYPPAQPTATPPAEPAQTLVSCSPKRSSLMRRPNFNFYQGVQRVQCGHSSPSP